MKPKSLLHCHSKNLHSVIIGRDNNDNLIRMFVADTGNLLWQNNINRLKNSPNSQELTIHSHKSDITLIPLTGKLFNISMSKAFSPEEAVQFNQYEYSSPIVNGTGGFTKIGKEIASLEMKEVLEPLYLHYSEKHTIFVPRNTTASWLVVEGEYAPKNITDKAICYSTKNLEQWTPTEYYQEMDVETEKLLLSKYFLNKRVQENIVVEPNTEHDNLLQNIIKRYEPQVSYSYDELIEQYRDIRAVISHEVNYGSIHCNRYSPDYIPMTALEKFESGLIKLADYD